MTHEYCRQPAQTRAISVLCLNHVRHACIMTVIISRCVYGGVRASLSNTDASACFVEGGGGRGEGGDSKTPLTNTGVLRAVSSSLNPDGF